MGLPRKYFELPQSTATEAALRQLTAITGFATESGFAPLRAQLLHAAGVDFGSKSAFLIHAESVDAPRAAREHTHGAEGLGRCPSNRTAPSLVSRLVQMVWPAPMYAVQARRFCVDVPLAQDFPLVEDLNSMVVAVVDEHVVRLRSTATPWTLLKVAGARFLLGVAAAARSSLNAQSLMNLPFLSNLATRVPV